MRAFAVFEKSGSDWKLVMLHEAIAVDQPGAGAAFKKFVPPKLDEEPPPEVAEPKQADPKKAKKKPAKAKPKKNKKKVVVEDEDE